MEILIPKFSIRSKTNRGEYAKQYFLVAKSDFDKPSLIIRKLVLSSDFDLYQDYRLLRIYKDKGLFMQTFSIKISTLKIVFNIMNEIIENDY